MMITELVSMYDGATPAAEVNTQDLSWTIQPGDARVYSVRRIEADFAIAVVGRSISGNNLHGVLIHRTPWGGLNTTQLGDTSEYTAQVCRFLALTVFGENPPLPQVWIDRGHPQEHFNRPPRPSFEG